MSIRPLVLVRWKKYMPLLLRSTLLLEFSYFLQKGHGVKWEWIKLFFFEKIVSNLFGQVELRNVRKLNGTLWHTVHIVVSILNFVKLKWKTKKLIYLRNRKLRKKYGNYFFHVKYVLSVLPFLFHQPIGMSERGSYFYRHIRSKSDSEFKN